MILFVTTKEHMYTHAGVAAEQAIEARVVSYDDLFADEAPQTGTYIFMDLDRLASWQVRDAAFLYRKLRAGGCRVLNDPARFPTRQGLLRRLNRAGINDFDAHRVEDLVKPTRWPVILRLDGTHGKPVAPLLEDWDQLLAAAQRAIARGFPISSLLVIEYSAEPVQPGLYRKFSVFRVGDAVLGYTCTHDDNWLVKYGKPGMAPAPFYEEEYGIVRDNPFGEQMARVFDLAGIEYGRVDFGLVGGRPQVYEINTNPRLDLLPKPAPNPWRDRSTALFRDNYLQALKAIDTATAG